MLAHDILQPENMLKLTTLVRRRNRHEVFSILYALLELLGFGCDGAKLMFEARRCTVSIESRHHLVLRLANGRVTDGHEEHRNTVRRHHLLIAVAFGDWFGHVVICCARLGCGLKWE